jgi:hypothetical protein
MDLPLNPSPFNDIIGSFLVVTTTPPLVKG